VNVFAYQQYVDVSYVSTQYVDDMSAVYKAGLANKKRSATLIANAASSLSVSFTSPTGITHGVDVEAETLYEAAGIAFARLKNDGWIEGLGPGSRLEITIREPGTTHSLTVHQLHRWVDAASASPAEALRRARVKELMGHGVNDSTRSHSARARKGESNR
jgi:hypothetical protein